MTHLEHALLISLIPLVAIWLAIFNPFLKVSQSFNAYIQATSAGFLTGSLLFELGPKLSNHGIKPQYIIAFAVGAVIILLVQGNESSCCSGNSKAKSLSGFLLPFIAEFLITGMLIGIAAVAGTTLIYIIAISFGLCNFVCGSSIASRLIHTEASLAKRFSTSVFLSSIFPIVAALTVIFVSYLTETMIGELIALALAWLLYLIVFELLPETNSLSRRTAEAVFFTGVTFVFALNYLLA